MSVYDVLEDVSALSVIENAVANATDSSEKAAAIQKYHEAFAARSSAVSAAIAQHEQKAAPSCAGEGVLQLPCCSLESGGSTSSSPRIAARHRCEGIDKNALAGR